VFPKLSFNHPNEQNTMELKKEMGWQIRQNDDFICSTLLYNILD
jgi:hypothetical protein